MTYDLLLYLLNNGLRIWLAAAAVAAVALAVAYAGVVRRERRDGEQVWK